MLHRGVTFSNQLTQQRSIRAQAPLSALLADAWTVASARFIHPRNAPKQMHALPTGVPLPISLIGVHWFFGVDIKMLIAREIHFSLGFTLFFSVSVLSRLTLHIFVPIYAHTHIWGPATLGLVWIFKDVSCWRFGSLKISFFFFMFGSVGRD